MTTERNTELDVLDAPTPADMARFVATNTPVLIRGVVDQWEAFKLWTPDYLANQVGDRPVPVHVMSDGDYARSTSRTMTVTEYLSKLDAATGEERLYMGEVKLREHLPELLEQLEVPDYFAGENLMAVALYFGQDLFSQLHYHLFGSAALCQIHGHKRVWLYPPDQTPLLSKYPWYTKNANMSRTTSPAPDPAEFPEFAKAKGIELVVNAGEMLFIPVWWWHAIQNEELNIAVPIFWYQSVRTRWLPPAGMRATYFLELARKPVRKLLAAK